MDKAQFGAVMASRGCVTDGKIYCGVFEGYPFAVVYLNGTPGGKTSFALHLIFENTSNPRRFFKPLVGQFKPQAALAMPYTGGQPRAVFSAALKKDTDVAAFFDSLVAAVVRTARENGLATPATCPVCRQGGCDSYGFVGDYRQVHAACVQNQSAEKQMQVAMNEQHGNTALGVLGGVLGGIIGSLPTVLLIVFANFISGWLCALVPLGAYYGYKLFRGRMTGAVLGIVIAISALMAPVVLYLSELAFGIKEYGFLLSPIDYFAFFAANFSDLLPGLLQTLLFLGIGVFVVFGIIRRGNQHEWQAATFTMQTLRPIAGAAQPAPQPAMPQPGQPEYGVPEL